MENETTKGLTREQLTALKECTSVTFRLTRGTGWMGMDSICKIVCIARPRKHSVFQGEELRFEFSVNSSRLPDEFNQAFFMIHFTNRGAFRALTLLLKEGDEISLRVSENGNGYLEKAMIPFDRWPDEDKRYHGTYDHLYNDCLFVTVNRHGKTLLQDLELQNSLCPDNSERALRK